MSDGLHLSTGLDVLRPKSGNAFPIPCAEWDFLKGKLKKVSVRSFDFQDLASLLGGVALSTAAALVTGTLPAYPQSQSRLIAWSVVVVTSICALVALLFERNRREIQVDYVQEVVLQMEIIEERFESPASDSNAKSG